MVFLDYDKNSLIITYFKSGNITKINKIIKLLEKLRDNMISRQSSRSKLKESYSIDNNQGEYQSSNSDVDSNISEINNSEKETIKYEKPFNYQTLKSENLLSSVCSKYSQENRVKDPGNSYPNKPNQNKFKLASILRSDSTQDHSGQIKISKEDNSSLISNINNQNFNVEDLLYDDNEIIEKIKQINKLIREKLSEGIEDFSIKYTLKAGHSYSERKDTYKM